LPIVISFLASLLGLGNLSQKIKTIIQKVQAPINKAVEWVLGMAKAAVKKLGSKLGIGKESKDTPNEFDVKAKAGKELKQRLNKPVTNAQDVQPVVTTVYDKYRPEGLKALNVVSHPKQPGKFQIYAYASPGEPKLEFSTVLGIEIADLFPLVGKKGFGKTTASGYMMAGNKPVNLGKYESVTEQEQINAENHAEQLLLDDLDNEWEDVASLTKENYIVLEVTRTPCADCSLAINHFINEKRAQGYTVRIKVRALTLYGGAYKKKKDEEGLPALRFEGTKLALKDLKKPAFELEPWDIFAELAERGIKIDPSQVSQEDQQKLRRRIEEIKQYLLQIEGVKAGTK
jgi:hypothetical protein